MKIKVSETTNNQLDWLVAKVLGIALPHGLTEDERYSTDPAQGQPILEKEGISTVSSHRNSKARWFATLEPYAQLSAVGETGPTMLVAGMRCYVVSRLGLEVEVPDGLA